MKLFLAIWISAAVGATAAATLAKPDEPLCQVRCTIADMLEVRMRTAECQADGGAALECLERARAAACGKP